LLQLRVVLFDVAACESRGESTRGRLRASRGRDASIEMRSLLPRSWYSRRGGSHAWAGARRGLNSRWPSSAPNGRRSITCGAAAGQPRSLSGLVPCGRAARRRDRRGGQPYRANNGRRLESPPDTRGCRETTGMWLGRSGLRDIARLAPHICISGSTRSVSVAGGEMLLANWARASGTRSPSMKSGRREQSIESSGPHRHSPAAPGAAWERDCNIATVAYGIASLRRCRRSSSARVVQDRTGDTGPRLGSIARWKSSTGSLMGSALLLFKRLIGTSRPTSTRRGLAHIVHNCAGCDEPGQRSGRPCSDSKLSTALSYTSLHRSGGHRAVRCQQRPHVDRQQHGRDALT